MGFDHAISLLSFIGAILFGALYRNRSESISILNLPWLVFSPWILTGAWVILAWLGCGLVLSSLVLGLIVLLLLIGTKSRIQNWRKTLLIHTPAILTVIGLALVPLFSLQILEGKLLPNDDSGVPGLLAKVSEPPEDYFGQRLKLPLNAEQSEYRFSVVHQYRGRYEIGLLLCGANEDASKGLSKQVKFQVIQPKSLELIAYEESFFMPIQHPECSVQKNFAYYALPGLGSPSEPLDFVVQLDFPAQLKDSLFIHVSKGGDL